MNTKTDAPIVATAARGTTCAAIALIALFLVTACGGNSGSSADREAAMVQKQAAKKLGVHVEKTLAKSGIVLRLIPDGTFAMGSPTGEKDRLNFEAQHKVTLPKAFYIGKFEVTQGQWKKVMGTNPSSFKNAGDNAPVEKVSWDNCQAFMKKLATLEGMPEGSFRLPTEAEWEHACRAGTPTTFCYGDNLDSRMANFNGEFPYGSGEKGEFRKTTLPVGTFKPNAWGLYDMHGNVAEWCADWYGKYGGDATDPRGPATGPGRVVRGGSWTEGAAVCRSASRGNSGPGDTDDYRGFRLCLPSVQ